MLLFTLLAGVSLKGRAQVCPTNTYIQIGNCVVDYKQNINPNIKCTTTVCADENCNVPITFCVYGDPGVLPMTLNFKTYAAGQLQAQILLNKTITSFAGQNPPPGDPYCFTFLVPMSAIHNRFVTGEFTFSGCTEDYDLFSASISATGIFVIVDCASGNCLDPNQGGGGGQ